MVDMSASFLGKAKNREEIFDRREAAGLPQYRMHINQYNVIHIDFSEFPKGCLGA